MFRNLNLLLQTVFVFVCAVEKICREILVLFAHKYYFFVPFIFTIINNRHLFQISTTKFTNSNKHNLKIFYKNN